MAKYTTKRKHTKKSTNSSVKTKAKKSSKKKEVALDEPFIPFSYETEAPETLWGKIKSFFSF